MVGYLQVLRGKRIITSFILALIPAFLVLAVEADSSKWIRITSPINSDLKHLSFLSNQKGFASGKQIIYYENNEWLKYSPQPPSPIDLFFPIDTNSFYISSKTKYQESDLYYGNGKTWERIWSPLANIITAMDFTDSANGIIAGLGEIAIMKDRQWKWFPPPHNHVISTIHFDKDSVLWAFSPMAGLFKLDGKWTKIEGSDKAASIQFYENSVYIMGDDFFGIVNSDDSIKVISRHPELNRILSFLFFKEDEIIAVGTGGLILHFVNGEWQEIESGVQERLNAIWLDSENSGWIVGDDGVILYLTSEEVEPFDARYWAGFELITFNSLAKVVDDEYGVVMSDFNNDGKVDIFTCGLYEADHLYINNGNNSFIDKAQQWNVSGAENINLHELNLGACAGDFDNDGDDDLYVSVLNGSNKLYKNIRGKYFVDYSDQSRSGGKGGDRTNASILGDVDNDGDIDIFVANEQRSNRLFLNNGAGIFSEATKSSGLLSKFGGTGCSFGDIDNDGDLDLFVANWSTKNVLYKNQLKETGQLLFKNVTRTANVGGEVFSKSNSVVFSDIDNDADLDLFITNRKTSNRLFLNDGKGKFSDRTAEFMGIDSLKSYGAVISDFDGDGFKDIYVSNIGSNILYKNIEGKRFDDKTIMYGAGIEGYSTGSAVADFDNNGSPDLYIANYLGESSAILRNKYNNFEFIKLDIESVKNNRSGIGVKIFVYQDNSNWSSSEVINYSEESGGSGYASMNQRFLPIPTVGNEFVDVKVVFPSGIEKFIQHVKAGSNISIKDKSGINKTLLRTSQWLLFLVKDPHMLIKFLTWIFVLLVLAISMFGSSKKYGWSISNITLFSVLLLILFYFQSSYFEYKSIWLSSVLPVLSVLVVIVIVRLYFERIRIRKMALVDQEQIREKLSRDLHDDLATTVSTIGIYLTLIGYKLNDKEDKLIKLLDQTSGLVNDATTSITDLIWAISPKPQSLDDLIIRINSNFSTLFNEKGIKYISRCDSSIEQLMLSSKTKQNIYLIIKEALNNVLKYAEATEVKIMVKQEGPIIIISIKDVGKGFEYSAVKNKGHGLSNMNTRATEIKAHLEIKSKIGKGTEIILEFKPE